MGNQDLSVHAPPNNPDAAITKGWKHLDFGGNGDCLFRAVGAFVEFANGVATVSNEESIRCGAVLRKNCVQHIRGHAERCKDLCHLKLDGTGPLTFDEGSQNLWSARDLC